MRRHRRVAVLVAAVLGAGGLLIPAPAQSAHNTALKNAIRAQALARINGGTTNGGNFNTPVAAPACGRISVRLSLIEARLRSRGLIAAANRIAAVRVRLCSSP